MKSVSLLVFTLLLGPVAAKPETVEVFRGEYVWDVDQHRNQVEAVFTPVREGHWNVAFHFRYAHRKDTYKGEVVGSLEDGVISGDIRDGQGKTRYRIEARVEGSHLEGKHFDIWDGKKELTGTLHLERILE